MHTRNDLPEMVLIPSGEFLMGAVNDDDMGYTGAFREEKPQHTVYLEAYYIDTHLVTVGQYHKFMQAADYRPERWEDRWLNAPLQPVRSISLPDVLAYCDWAGNRLPTEAEWEKAARGGLIEAQYPWGDDAFDGSQAPDLEKEESPPDVGTYPPNGYGLYDMVGSLWQWCKDDRRLYSRDRRHCPVGPLGGETRSSRGGDWFSHPFHKRCSRRGSVTLTGGSGNLGFRCVRDESDA
jgi:iron(II)-dependent oxidoreductase